MEKKIINVPVCHAEDDITAVSCDVTITTSYTGGVVTNQLLYWYQKRVELSWYHALEKDH